MSHNVTIELPDEIYQVLKKVAPQQGLTIEALAMEWVARYTQQPRKKLTKKAQQAAWECLRRHQGAENLGHPTDVNNESIDAELARAYGSAHEGGV